MNVVTASGRVTLERAYHNASRDLLIVRNSAHEDFLIMCNRGRDTSSEKEGWQKKKKGNLERNHCRAMGAWKLQTFDIALWVHDCI